MEYIDMTQSIILLKNRSTDLLEQLPPSFEDFKVVEPDSESTEEDVVAAIYKDLDLFALADNEEERVDVLYRMEDRLYECNDSAINRAVLIGLKAELSEDVSILEERDVVANITAAVAGADLTVQETLAVIRDVIDYYKERDSSLTIASNTNSQVETENSYSALANSNMNERALGANGLTATAYGAQVQRIIAGEVDLTELDNGEVAALQEGWALIGEPARIAITNEAAILGADRAMVAYEGNDQIELSNVNNGVEFFGLIGGVPAQQAFLAEVGYSVAAMVGGWDLSEAILNIASISDSQGIDTAMTTLAGNSGIDNSDLGLSGLGSIGSLGSVSTGDNIQPDLAPNELVQSTVIDIDGLPSSISILLKEDDVAVSEKTSANSLAWASLVVDNPEIESIDLRDQELALLVEARQIPVEFLEVIKNNTENYDIPNTSYALFGNLNFFEIYSTLNMQNTISNFVSFLLGDVRESTRLIDTELDVDNKITFDSPGAIIKDILEKLNPKKTEETAKLRLAMPKKIKLSHFVVLFFSLLVFSCSLGYSAGVYHIKSRKI